MLSFLPIGEAQKSALPLVNSIFTKVKSQLALAYLLFFIFSFSALGQQANLVGYWQFDEGAGNQASDISSTGAVADQIGFGAWGGVSPAAGSTWSRQLLNGGYMRVNDNAIYNTMANEMTIEAWIWPQDAGNNAIIDRANYNFLFQTHPNGQPGLGFYNLNGGWSYSSTPIATGGWTHVAMTWNSSTGELKFYVNGNLTDTFSRGPLSFSSGDLNIGRQDPNGCQCNTFDGYIDELRLWNDVRTQAEIQAFRNVELPQNFVVTNTSDSGAGSFRQAILDANANPGVDNIEFDLGGGTPQINLSSQVTATEGVIIDGATGGATKVRLQFNNNGIALQNNNDSEIKNLEIVRASGTAYWGLNVSNGSNLLVDNVKISNFTDPIITNGVNGLTITNNDFTTNLGGPRIYNGSDARVDNNIIDSRAWNYYYLTLSNISSNQISGGFTASGNTYLQGDGSGFSITTMDGLTISGSSADNPNILVGQEINTGYRGSGYGVFINNSPNTSIKNLTMRSGGRTGVYATNSSGLSIVGVTTGNMSYYAFELNNNVNDATILNSDAAFSGGGLYVYNSSDLIVKDNKLNAHNSGYYGLWLNRHLVNQLTNGLDYSNNEIYSNNGSGIRIDNTPNLTISGSAADSPDILLDQPLNTGYRGSGYGIYIASSANTSVKNLTMRSGGRTGVYANNSTDLLIDGVTTGNMSYYAFELNNSVNNATILNSDVAFSGGGVYAYNSSDLTIKDNKLNAHNSGYYGLWLNGHLVDQLTNGLDYANNEIYSNNGSGIRIDNTPNLTISGSSADNPDILLDQPLNTGYRGGGFGVYIASSANTSVKNLTMRSGGSRGVYANNSPNLLIDGVTTGNMGYYAFELYNAVNNAIIINSDVALSTGGVYVYNSSDLTIKDNKLNANNSGYYGLYLNRLLVDQFTNGLDYSNNEIYSNNGSGIRLDNTPNLTISGSSADSPDILLDQPLNTGYRSGGFGLYIASSANTSVKNLTMRSGGSRGVYANNSPNLLIDGVTTGNMGYYAFELYNQVNNSTIINSDVALSNGGVYVYNSSDLTIKDNKLNANNSGYYGLYLNRLLVDQFTNGLDYSNNEIYSNNGSGIRLDNTPNLTISGSSSDNPDILLDQPLNTGYRGGGYGVFIASSANTSIKNLTMRTGGRTGVRATNSSDLLIDGVTTGNMGYYAFELYSVVNNATVINSDVASSQGGLYIYNSKDLTVKNTKLNNSNRDHFGLYLYSLSSDVLPKGLVYENNELYSNTGGGIYLVATHDLIISGDANDSPDILIEQTLNGGASNGGYGVRTNGANNIQIKNLDIEAGGIHGIRSDNSDNLLIENVNVLGSYSFGYYLYNSNDYAVVRNSSSGNSGGGLYFYNGKDLTLEDLTLNGTNAGIWSLELYTLIPDQMAKGIVATNIDMSESRRGLRVVSSNDLTISSGGLPNSDILLSSPFLGNTNIGVEIVSSNNITLDGIETIGGNQGNGFVINNSDNFTGTRLIAKNKNVTFYVTSNSDNVNISEFCAERAVSYGILNYSPSATFSNGRVLSHGQYAVYHSNGQDMNMANVWWGSDQGPSNFTTGGNNRVYSQSSGNIVYQPFLTVDPDCPCLTPGFEQLAGTFTISATNPIPGQEVTFTADDVVDGAVYNWDFGDGNTATGQSVNHTFTADQASYQVSLSIQSGEHCVAGNTVTVNMADAIPPTVILNDAITVELDETGGAAITSSDVDNGSFDNSGGALTFSFSQSNFVCSEFGATLVVTVTVADEFGNEASDTINVTVSGTDTDGDGYANPCDLDDDNDGILDADECSTSLFFWSDAPTVTGNNTASGSINGIGYTYTSNQQVLTSPSIAGFSVLPQEYEIPNQTVIRNINASSNTLSFNEPMTNPVLVFASIGASLIEVPVQFYDDFTIIWGEDYRNGVQNPLPIDVDEPNNLIRAREGYAIIRFEGTFNSLSFDYLTSENYVNFAFGADFFSLCDFDEDGITNDLDLDTDNDGCSDAVEGALGLGLDAINADGSLSAAVDNNGVPTSANGGQGVGTSANASADCECELGIDQTVPTISLIGTDITQNQFVAFNDPGATADDNCSVTVQVSGSVDINTVGTYTLTYKAVDANGNESQCRQ